MDKIVVYCAATFVVGIAVGFSAKVESKTRTIVRETQPKCEHKFRSLSCVIGGESSIKTANVIQECEKCGAVRKERLYL